MSIVLYIRTVTPVWARLFQFWRLKLAKQFLSLFRQRCTLHLTQKVHTSDVQFLFFRRFDSLPTQEDVKIRPDEFQPLGPPSR